MVKTPKWGIIEKLEVLAAQISTMNVSLAQLKLSFILNQFRFNLQLRLSLAQLNPSLFFLIEIMINFYPVLPAVELNAH